MPLRKNLPPQEYLRPNPYLPLIEETQFLIHAEQQMIANLPANERYLETTLQKIKLEDKIYILYEYTKRSRSHKSYYQAKVIAVDALTITLHFMDATKFSGRDEEITAEIKLVETHHSIYLLPKYQQNMPPPSPVTPNAASKDIRKMEKSIEQMAKNHAALTEQMAKDQAALTKQFTDLAATVTDSLKTNNDNITNLSNDNKTSHKALKQQLHPLRNLPPGEDKPKAFDEANARLEVVISNLILKEGEDLEQKVIDLAADHKELKLNRTDIHVFLALDKKKKPGDHNNAKPPNAILTFKREAHKKAFVASKVNNEYVNIKNDNGTKIYINENLTAAQRRLFWLVRIFKKDNEHKYKFAWTENGVVKLRQNAGFGLKTSYVHTIENEETLEGLKA
jgi:gas vesicle protein